MARLSYQEAMAALNHQNAHRAKKMRCGPRSMVKHEQDKDVISDLIMNQGVTIDECAEKWDVHPMTICRLMGWV